MPSEWGEWLVGGIKTRGGIKALKRKEEIKKEKERMYRKFWREARERPYLIPTGYIEEGKPPRKQPKSYVDRMICSTGNAAYEWREGPGMGNDPLLPSEQRDVTAIAYNTRARQCVCYRVQTDCHNIIKQIRQTTDNILDKDILCGGGIRERLQDIRIFLSDLENYVKKNIADSHVLPDGGEHTQWAIAANKACKALEHQKKPAKR